MPPPTNPTEVGLDVLQRALAKVSGQQSALHSGYVSLREWLPLAWPVMDATVFAPNWHIDAICDHLEAVTKGDITRLVINMPPAFGKSLVTSVGWPAWVWGPGGKPSTRWLCLSYGGDVASPANRDAVKCRDLIVSDWYQQQWGTAFQLSDVQNAKSYFTNDKKGHRVSTGIDGEASGQRADVVLYDDPTKLDETTLAGFLKPAKFHETTGSNRLDPKGGAIVCVMQRLSPDDLSGYFLKRDGWVHLRLPMFYEPDRKCVVLLPSKKTYRWLDQTRGRLFFSDPRTQHGEPLHKDMEAAIEEAEYKSRQRPDLYIAQYQQRPESSVGQIIRRIDRFDVLPTIIDETIVTVDCAFKDGEKNSWVVFQKWCRRNADACLVAQARGHWQLPETTARLAAFCTHGVAVNEDGDPYGDGDYRGLPGPIATAKYVEAKANGIGVVQTLRNKVAGLMTTDDDDTLKDFCKQSKQAKLQSVAAYYDAGNVRIPTLAWLVSKGMVDWTPGYIHELTHFPGADDDQVDASAMAVWKLLRSFDVHVSAAELVAHLINNPNRPEAPFDAGYGAREEAGLIVARASGFAVGGTFGTGELARKAFGH